MSKEILLLPSLGQGHLFPFIELCKHLSKRNYRISLIISSAATSSIPSSLTVDYPLIQIAEIPFPEPQPKQGPPLTGFPNGNNPFQNEEMERGIESLLSARPEDSRRPICVVIDAMMSWSKVIFAKFSVPVVLFFASGACSTAMAYAMWKAGVSELKPGESRTLPGLPDTMSVSYEEVNRQPRNNNMPPSEGKFMKGSPPQPGDRPIWLPGVEGCIAILINTCSELDDVFLNYVAVQLGVPVWGVGPLLPEQYWKSADCTILHDMDFRPNKNSSHSEEEVLQWLDSKPYGSVLYVSFGSDLSPRKDELPELATALEKSNKSFIWVIRPGPNQPGLESDVDTKVGAGGGGRGLIIHGWAPQLLILSHPSTGGFLSHCGWNSTAEAIVRGVPFLAWPIARDQFNNARMVTAHLKIGYLVKETDFSENVSKDDIVRGIQKLMGDAEVKKRALLVKERFEAEFPKTSDLALDAFGQFLKARDQHV